MTDRCTDRTRVIRLIGVLCIVVGYWAPWVAHRAAGLTQNAFDLGEFARFLPQVRDGSEPFMGWLLLLPLTTASLSLGLVRRGSSLDRWGRIGALPDGLSFLLLTILVPPYPYTVQRLLDDEFLARTLLSAVSWACYLALVWRRRRISSVTASLLLSLLTAAGTLAPVGQFLSLRDSLSAAYGEPIAIGWGMWLAVAGSLIVLGHELAVSRISQKTIG